MSNTYKKIMKKRAIKVLYSIIIVIIGIALVGFGFTTKLGHPISTISFIFGLVLAFIGFIFFIKISASNK